MSTADYLFALESLGSSTTSRNDSDSAVVIPVVDWLDLPQLGRRRHLCSRSRSQSSPGGGARSGSNPHNLLMLPPPPPLYSNHSTARTGGNPGAVAATRSAVLAATTDTTNIISNDWNAQAQMFLDCWRENNAPIDDNGNGYLTSRMMMSAMTSAREGLASSPSSLVPYAISSPSSPSYNMPRGIMGRIGDQRLSHHDHSNHYHQYCYHRHPQQLLREQQQQQLAVVANAEQLIALTNNAMVSIDSRLERLQLILDIIHGNSNPHLYFNDEATTRIPILGHHLGLAGAVAEAEEAATARGSLGNVHDNSNSFALPIHEEISSPATVEEMGDGHNDSPPTHAAATVTAAPTPTIFATVSHDTTADFSSIASTPSPTSRPVRQAAAIATHDMRGGDTGAPSTITARARATTLPTRINTKTTTSSGGRKMTTPSGIDRHGAMTLCADVGNSSNGKIDSSNIVSSTATPTSPADKKDSLASSPPTCCICLEEPSHEELSSIDSCAHPFCFSCIERWADQENTCPLCKARFHKIDRLNTITRKRKDIGSESEGKGGEQVREEERSSKRVRNRDQRSDALRFGSLEDIFESLESNGTWPTHIAQLLFSGLGASSRVGDLSGVDRSTLPAGSGLRPTRRYMTAVSTAHNRQSYQRHATTANTGNDVLDLTHWNESTNDRRDRDNSSVLSSYLTGGSSQYHRGGMHPATSLGTTTTTTTTSTTTTTTTTSILGNNLHLGARGTIAYPTSPAWLPTRRGTSTFDANSTTGTPPTHSNPFASLDAFSPWPGSASTGMPLLDRGGFEGASLSTRTAAYHHPSAPAATIDAWDNNPFLTGEEEEEILSTMSALSPSAYVRSLHRELEQGQGGTHSQRQDRLGRQYQVSSNRPSSSEEVTSTTSGSTPLSVYFDRLRHECERGNQRQVRLSRQYQVDTFRGATSANSAPAALNPRDVQRRQRQNTCPWNNAAGWAEAGRTVETALEIVDSDDDDVVEVIDVEALP